VTVVINLNKGDGGSSRLTFSLWMLLQVNVGALATGSPKDRELEISQAARIADSLLSAGKDTLIMTSRQLVTGSSKFLGQTLNEPVE
jgi:hypothetical protein